MSVNVKLRWTLTSNDIYFTDYYVVSSVNPVSGTLTTLATVFTPDTYFVDAAGTLQLTPFPFPVVVSVPPGTKIVVQAHGMASQPGFGGGGLSVPSNQVTAGGAGPFVLTIGAVQCGNDEQSNVGYGVLGTDVTFPALLLEPSGGSVNFGTLSGTLPFGTVKWISTSANNLSCQLLSLVVDGGGAAPSQGAFTTISYTDSHSVLRTFNTAAATYSISGSQSLWQWDLSSFGFGGFFTNPVTVTLT